MSVNGAPVHLFSAFALVNVFLYSAISGKSTGDKATKEMKQNCSEKFSRAIKLLEPTHILIEGTGTGRELANKLCQESHRELIWLEYGKQDLKETKVVGLPHPSARGRLGYGASPRNQFLVDEIAPKMREVHEALLRPMTRCVFCGCAGTAGGSCVQSPTRRHVVPEPGRCAYCGTRSTPGGSCVYSPHRVHAVLDPGKCTYCGTVTHGGGSCVKSPTRRHVSGILI